MSSSGTRRPEPCVHENCGSRRFHLGEDGFTYCDRGHQQSEIGAFVAQDTGEFVVLGTKSKVHDSDVESFTSRASGFSGTHAFEHYLLCLQLILRKQLRWLIEVKQLPKDLEALVRDLWALRLQKLQQRTGYDSGTDTETQTQYFSSQSEGETSASQTTRRSVSSAARIQQKESTPTLQDLLGLCYAGSLLLRVPLTVADFYRWCNDGELLYYRAAHEVPMSMRERLPPVYQELLEPRPWTKPEKLHASCVKVLRSLHADFGMALPRINHPPILHGWVKRLALPIETLAGTLRLARLLDIDFAYEPAKQGASKNAMLRYPEVRMVALLVVATKLLFPFDNTKRSPLDYADLTSLCMDWQVWSELQPQSWQDTSASTYADALHFSQRDVLTASGDALDAYMDWVQYNVASENIRERGRAGRDAEFRRTLFRIFPLAQDSHVRRDERSVGDEETGRASQHADTTSANASGGVLRQAQTVLNVKRVVAAADEDEENAAARVGSFYRRIKTSTDLAGAARAVHERAANLAGVSLEGLLRAVSLLEQKMISWETGARKAAKG